MYQHGWILLREHPGEQLHLPWLNSANSLSQAEESDGGSRSGIPATWPCCSWALGGGYQHAEPILSQHCVVLLKALVLGIVGGGEARHLFQGSRIGK